MTAIDYVLDGLEAELRLERELGVRAVECDRALVEACLAAARTPGAASTPSPAPRPAPAPAAAPAPRPAPASAATPAPTAAPVPAATPAPATAPATATPPFVFLTDRPLSPPARELLSKAVTALGYGLEQTPVLAAAPFPRAPLYVVLGAAALRKHVSACHPALGAWFTSPKGAPMLYTRSPEEIVRFRVVTPQLEKMKRELWASWKSILTHLKGTQVP